MNLPVDFSRMMTALLGADDFESFNESLAQESPASIRFVRGVFAGEVELYL